MGGDPEFGEAIFSALFAYEGKIYNLSLQEGDDLRFPDGRKQYGTTPIFLC